MIISSLHTEAQEFALPKDVHGYLWFCVTQIDWLSTWMLYFLQPIGYCPWFAATLGDWHSMGIPMMINMQWEWPRRWRLRICVGFWDLWKLILMQRTCKGHSRSFGNILASTCQISPVVYANWNISLNKYNQFDLICPWEASNNWIGKHWK